jgi:hypothetical protein
MSFRAEMVSCRRFSLGTLAAPIAAALGTGVSAAQPKAGEPAESPEWIADTSAPPFGLTETFAGSDRAPALLSTSRSGGQHRRRRCDSAHENQARRCATGVLA